MPTVRFDDHHQIDLLFQAVGRELGEDYTREVISYQAIGTGTGGWVEVYTYQWVDKFTKHTKAEVEKLLDELEPGHKLVVWRGEEGEFYL